ncbi:ROK family protein [soil metagenome]
MSESIMSRTALGIDVGGTGIKGAPVNLATGVLTDDRERYPTPQPATPERVAGALRKMAKEFKWEGPIGITVPARVRAGTVETASNIDKAWIGLPAQDYFGQYLNREVTVLNDADAAGLGELHFGAARQENGLVLMLTFGTGIGSALFVNRTLVPNTELGHLEFRGGIAEKYAANSVRRDKKLSWEDWAKRVQQYLTHLEFLFAPDVIVVGGGVSKPGRWEQFAPLLKTRADLRRAEAGNDAGIIGAAWATTRAESNRVEDLTPP